MKSRILTLMICILMLPAFGLAQKQKTDANIIGHVVDEKGEHIPFANISLEGTTIGTATDETGHFRMVNMPPGSFVIKARFLGYKEETRDIVLLTGETLEVNFTLSEDLLGLKEVVITGDRSETNRTESSTIVNTITPKLFNTIQSVTLSESLNFSPGLRMEANCQNCGFTQVRMNGMEGPYSQVLINSRPVLSGLAGVYGLELIPSNMIDRVEVIRGGGSALYGSNAIAGTINIILKDPVSNSFAFSASSGLVGTGIKGAGDPANDNYLTFNTTLTTADHKGGMSVYGYYRNRDTFDANNDQFSELTSINNITIGSRMYHRMGTRAKLVADVFNIRETRRGGDKMDYLPHMTGITEAADHKILNGSLSYELFCRTADLLSVYVSGQKVTRESYYGSNRSLRDYGNTDDFTYTFGSQYNAGFENSKLLAGVEYIASRLKDKKMGYPDIGNASWNPADSTITIPYTDNLTIANQSMHTMGTFAQYEFRYANLQVSAGARFDLYRISNYASENADNDGKVLSPRLTLKYDILDYLQARVSYSQGYRAPQIFDEDLHILTSGSRQVIHKNAADLKQESSFSYMASLDLNKKIGSSSFGFLIEGFYTRLDDAFVNEIGTPDEEGKVIYTRKNAPKGAFVSGINMEINWLPSSLLSLKGGFTIQRSEYEEVHEFNEKRFFRTPGNYGYLALDWLPADRLGISATSSYTGKMLVPYFGLEQADPEAGELRESGLFFDIGAKIRYNIELNGTALQVFAGAKNILNSYQDDFDHGIDRDPGYVYGPLQPRTIYLGLKFGNNLN